MKRRRLRTQRRNPATLDSSNKRAQVIRLPRACGFLAESGFPNRLSSDPRCASGGLAMARPYSQDLRERALARFEAGETIRSIGKTLGIDPSCVPKWVKRRRETGSVAPAAIGGRKPRTLSGDIALWLRERLHSGRFTTRGLAAELAERGVKTDRRAVWTFVREEGLSFKKKACSPASRIGLTSRASANAGRPAGRALTRRVSFSSTRRGSRRI
jgi:putative transposase